MKQDVKMSYEEDLVLFYNKYLNLGIGEGYLLILVNKCIQNWQALMNSKDAEKIIASGNFAELKSLGSNPVSFTKLDQEFLKFYQTATMKVNEDYDIVIDEYGNIINFNFKRNLSSIEQDLTKEIHQSIFKFLNRMPKSIEVLDAKRQAENVILQNTLVSKINKVVYEGIKTKDSIVSASIYAIAERDTISYEENLVKSVNYEKLVQKKLSRSRSLR